MRVRARGSLYHTPARPATIDVDVDVVGVIEQAAALITSDADVVRSVRVPTRGVTYGPIDPVVNRTHGHTTFRLVRQLHVRSRPRARNVPDGYADPHHYSSFNAAAVASRGAQKGDPNRPEQPGLSFRDKNTRRSSWCRGGAVAESRREGRARWGGSPI